MRWPRRVLLVLAALNGVGALGGALGLASGVLDLGPTLTDRLPWQSPVVAGVALGLLVAFPNAALAVLAWRRNRHTGMAGIAVGVAMVVWILVQVAIIGELSFFHPLYVAVGLVMVWAGVEAVRVDLGVSAASLGRVARLVAARRARGRAALPDRATAPSTAPAVGRATDGEVAAPLPGDRLTDPD